MTDYVLIEEPEQILSVYSSYAGWTKIKIEKFQNAGKNDFGKGVFPVVMVIE